MLGEKSMWESDPYAGAPIQNDARTREWRKHARNCRKWLRKPSRKEMPHEMSAMKLMIRETLGKKLA